MISLLLGAFCVALGFSQIPSSAEALEPPTHATKPLPGVSVKWVALDALVPGETARLELRILARMPIQEIRLEVPDSRATELILGAPPAYVGGLDTSEPLVFPVTIRVPGSIDAKESDEFSLQARVEVTTRVGTYRVASHLSLTTVPPVSGEPEPTHFLVASQTGPRAVSESTSPVVILTGRFLYRDRIQDPDGFVHASDGSNPTLPIRFADLEFLEDGNVIETGFTDQNGAFAFTAAPTGTESYTVRVKSTTTTWGGTILRVWASLGNLTPFTGVTGPITDPQVDTDFGDLVVEPTLGGEAFNILDACLNGAQLIETLEGTLPTTTLTIFWNGSSTEVTRFDSSGPSVFLLADEGYDDSVILHEYGHFAAFVYSKTNSPGGFHFVDDTNQDPRLSWSEGFASYFQSAVRNEIGDPFPSWYIDTQGSAGQGQLQFSYDAEGPSFAVQGSGSEVAVQALLWEIVDGANTPGDLEPGVDDDLLELPMAEIWEVLVGPILTASHVSLEDFWDGWFNPGVANGFAPEMEQAFGALGAEYFLDSHEDDGTVTNAIPLALDGTPAHHSFYPSGDQDHHRFDLTAGDAVTVETLNLLGHGDTRIEILGPDFLVIAANDDRGANDFSSLVSFTAPTTGTHWVRVVRSFADPISQFVQYGSYDIRAVLGVPNNPTLALLGSGSGVNNGGFGVGTGLADYDSDGWLDIFLVNNSGLGPAFELDALFRNTGGLTFTETTGLAGVGFPQGGIGVAWGDYDNDGDPDLFATDHALFRNNGNGTFTDRTAFSQIVDIGREFDAAWVDADSDGLLDLFVVRRDGPSALWNNNGDGTFTDVAPSAGFNFSPTGEDAYSCAWGDYDGDLLPDLFLALRADPGHLLYKNLGNNQFLDVTIAAGVQSSDPGSGGTWGDVNNDGLLDLFVGSTAKNHLYENQGNGTFLDESARYGVDDPGSAQGSGFADYDLDGDLDLYVANLTGTNILLENVNGSMVRVNQAADAGTGFGCVWGDLDNDGDPDLYLVRGCSSFCESNRLYRNTVNDSAPRPWLKVALHGTSSNRDGVGAHIIVHTPASTQFRQVGTGVGWATKSRTPELFGFPDSSGVDSVVVLWPSGIRDVVENPLINATLVVPETQTPVLPPEPVLPLSLSLGLATPNPFRGATTLFFVLNQSADVRVEIFDLQGRRIRTLISGEMGPGTHVAGWDGETDGGRSAVPGVYFYQVWADGHRQVRKIVRVSR